MKLIVTVALFEDDDAARWRDSDYTALQEHVGSRSVMTMGADAIGEVVTSQVRALLYEHMDAHSKPLEVTAE
jgi:hypothetical protein